MNTRRFINNVTNEGNDLYSLMFTVNGDTRKNNNCFTKEYLFKVNGDKFIFDNTEIKSEEIIKKISKSLGLSVKQFQIELQNRIK